MRTLYLTAEPRTPGKGPARAARREGRVPGVLYGPHAEPVHFTLDRRDLRPLVHTSENYRVSLSVDGGAHECMLKHVDYDPTSSVPAHVDFIAITRGEKLTITVPVVLVGVAPGVREGGDLVQPLHELEVRCLPADIPGHIDVDISGLNVGDSVSIGEVSVPNVEIHGDPSQPIVLVAGKKAEVEEVVELEEGEIAEGEGEGEEAAEQEESE
jgi:large subunit ribosomal protein L25